MDSHFRVDYQNAKSKKEAIFQGQKYRITVLTERLVRLEFNKNGLFFDDLTEQVINRNFPVPDFKVVEERDYISNTKQSGYRSFHVIIEYPIETLKGEKKILAEIQIRTLAMNFWATVEHTLRYKYDGDYPPEIQHRLERAAEAAFLLDEEMSEIKEEIQEAQKYYSKKRSKKHNND